MQSEDVIAVLDAAPSRRLGEGGRVQKIRREPLPRASTFAAERITASRADGTTLTLFFKDFCHSARGRAVSASRLERGRRELAVYRHLLEGQTFDTPPLAGWEWDPERARCWLLLEWVWGQPLSRVMSPDAWQATARWAARFHVRSRAIPRGELACVPSLEQLNYGVREEDVRARLDDASPSDRRLLERSLARVADARRQVAELPQGFIHGELFAANIIVRRATVPAAAGIAVVDWETAAIGSGYFDLVSLISGQEPEMRHLLLESYFDEYRAIADERLAWDRFRADVAIVEFAHAMKWVSWFAARKAAGRRWRHWLDELRRTSLD